MTTATTSLDALLLDIIAHPEDDAPRLIYADALEERGAPGDDARSEFVRVQVELATFPAEYEIAEGVVKVLYAGGENRATYARGHVPKSVQRDCERFLALRRRERELLTARGYAWMDAEFPLHKAGLVWWIENLLDDHDAARRATFRRGFVGFVACSLADWYGTACTRCHGTKRIRVTDMDKLEQIRSRGGHPFVPPQKTVACPDCLSTGRVGGHGPTLVQAQPLEEVRLTDRTPQNYHNNGGPALYGWYRGERIPSTDEPFNLPPVLWNILLGSTVHLHEQNGAWADFRTEDDANAALSAGLIAWAKEASRGA